MSGASNSSRKPRTVRVTEAMQKDFRAICMEHSTKKDDKIDLSSGSIQVDLTLAEIRQKLIDQGHNMAQETDSSGNTTCPALQGLVNSYRIFMCTNILVGIKEKLMNRSGDKFTNQVINVGGWNKFIVDNFHGGEGWKPGDMTEEQRVRAIELFKTKYSPTDAVKFKGGQRGRKAAIDAELIDSLAL